MKKLSKKLIAFLFSYKIFLKRTITADSVCHLCSEQAEDVLHALWGCVKVRQVWLRSFGWLVQNSTGVDSFSGLVRLVQTRPKSLPLFAVTAWAVWHHRNKSRLQAVAVPLNQTAAFAESYLQNYAAAHGVRRPPVRSIASVVKWKPSCELAVKVNFDGALFGESDCAGLGVVVRNSEGAVLAALSEKIMKPQSAELVEILAARRAVLFSSELGFHNLIIEGDSSSVIKLLQDRCSSHFQGGHILKDIMSHLDSFVSCSFSHVGRQGNAVAHALAQRARLYFPSTAWTEYVPPAISSFVLSDLRV